MSVIVDASVALKWVLMDETGVDAAVRLATTEEMAAPDFLLLEVANALAQAVRRQRITLDQARAGLRSVSSAGVRLVASEPLIGRALELAVELGRSAYDSLYLAAALQAGASLVTADTRFAAAAEAHLVYAPHVRRL